MRVEVPDVTLSFPQRFAAFQLHLEEYVTRKEFFTPQERDRIERELKSELEYLLKNAPEVEKIGALKGEDQSPTGPL